MMFTDFDYLASLNQSYLKFVSDMGNLTVLEAILCVIVYLVPIILIIWIVKQFTKNNTKSE